MKRLVALDWGTSSLRGALLDDQGQVLQEMSSPRGILNVPADGFAAVFQSHFGGWMDTPGTVCLISGMAGSRQGWREAPYCPCPTGLADVAARLLWLEPGRIALVPGVVCEERGVPDVMRGEEAQVFGALELLGLQDAQLVLPGTHSKWVQVRGGRIEHFRSFMTGEIYALLRQHSILARTLPEADGELDTQAFGQGLTQARASASLLHAAFTVRTLSLFERMAPAVRPSYLSGLLIGEELRTQSLDNTDAPVVVIGSDTLTARYRLALQSQNIAVQTVGERASSRCLWAIARQLKEFE